MGEALEADPPPVAGLADAWGAVVDMIATLGDVLARFDSMPTPERRSAVAEVHQMGEPMGAATEVLRTWK
jgi:hypothetical protein